MRLAHKLLLVALLPMLIGGSAMLIIGFTVNKAALQEEAEERALMRLDLVGAEIQGFFDRQIQSLTVLTASRVVQSGDVAAIIPQLKAWGEKLPNFEAVAYVEPDGAFHVPEGQTINVADRDYFQGISKGQTAFSNVLVSRVTNQPVMVILVPVSNPGDPASGGLAAAIQVTQLIELVRQIRIDKTGFALLVEDGGRVISSSMMPEAAGGVAESDRTLPPELDAVLKGHEASSIGPFFLKIGGEACRVYKKKMPSTRWSLLVVMKEAEVLGQVNRSSKVTMAMLIGTFLLAILVALFLHRLLSAPIRNLMGVHARIAAGDSLARAKDFSNDELGDLGRSFNGMANALADLNIRQRQRNEELSALNRLARMVTAQPTLDEACRVAVQEIAGTLRVDLSVLFVREGEDLILKAAWPSSESEQIDGAPVHRLGECLCGLAGRSGQPMFSLNIHQDERCTWNECKAAGFNSFAAIPLRLGTESVGVLGVASKVERDFELSATFLETAADHLAVSVHNARLFEKTRSYASDLEREIADRKQAEALLKAAVEQSPAGIFIADAPDGRIRMVNPVGLAIRGGPEEPHFGLPFALHPEFWHTFRPDGTPFAPEDLPLARAILKGETVSNVEVIIRRPDGENRWVLANAAPVRNDQGDIIAGMVVFPDITERKNIEESLKENEEKFRTIFEFAPFGMTISDLEGRILDVNAAMCDLGGVPRERLVGQSFSEFNQRFFDKSEQFLQLRQKMREQGWLKDEEAKLARGSDNKIRDVIFSARKITLSGEPCIVSMVVDVTDRKHLEDQLRQAQKMEAVGQLAGGVAHDFNNLLQAIIGYLEILMDDLGPGYARRQELMETFRAAERAAAVTRQLLAFSRRQVLELETLDLNGVVAELMKMVQRLIGENIELIVKPGHGLAPVEADRNQIEQVLMNLCVNARDAMPQGGSLIVETENEILDEQYCAAHDWAVPGRYVVVNVTDSGQGMDAKTQEMIFDPFFTTKELGKGTGLGLATVYGIVRQHQGMVRVYSEVGHGSRFAVYLPAADGAGVQPVEAMEEPIRGGAETILVAEDDPQIRLLAQRRLTASGYRVLTAADGEEALAVFRKHAGEIQLLLLDVVMPKKGGRTVFDEARITNPGVKCLFSSGYSDSAVHTNFILESGLHLLRKPYKRDKLLAAVRQVLDEGRVEAKPFEPEYPAAKASTGSESEADVPPPSTLAGVKSESPAPSWKVLVADDDTSIREICLLYLQKMGLEGITATDGKEAVAIFREHDPDIACVILDFQMPNLDGPAALHEIKKIRPDVRVVLATGFSESEARQKFGAEGFDGFMQKPYRLKDFKETITRIMDFS